MEKAVLVAGSGISGIGAVKLLKQVGRSVILYDGNEKLDREEIKRNAQDASLEVILGELTQDVLNKIEYCVISPGISLEVPFVQTLKESGIPIWSEIELAYHYAKGTLAAITGTNGKTTTTALLGAMVQNWIGKERGFIVGNIGIPYTQMAQEMGEDAITVAEISSFQLETIQTFHPKVSAILNITPDHLNRHHTMECYTQVKESITKNQTDQEWCILNYEDERLRQFGDRARVKVLYFSSKRKLEEGMYLDGDLIMLRYDKKEYEICNIGECHLVGICNYENIMAASGMAYCLGVPMDVIKKTVKEFRAVEHRIEFVEEIEGVRYYNDSKGTNPDAAIQGIRAMNRPTFIIAGGYDKGSEYDEWITEFGDKVKRLVLLGQTAEKIADCARKHGFTHISFVSDLKEAVALCAREAKPGDAVLLSPACASWGMFINYEERGRIFKELVRERMNCRSSHTVE